MFAAEFLDVQRQHMSVNWCTPFMNLFATWFLLSCCSAMGMVDYVQHPQCMQEIAQGLDAKECLDYEKSEIERKMRKQLLPEFADEEDDEGHVENFAIKADPLDIEIPEDMKNTPSHIDVFFALQVKERLQTKGTEFDVQGLDPDSWIRARVVSAIDDLIMIEFDCLYSLSLPIWASGETLFEIVELFQEGLFKWSDDSQVQLDGFGFRINDYCVGPIRSLVLGDIEFEFQDTLDDRWIAGKILAMRGDKVTIDYACRDMSNGLIESTVENFEQWVMPLAEASRFVWLQKPGHSKYVFRENLYGNRPNACKHDSTTTPAERYQPWVYSLRENYKLLHTRETKNRLQRQRGTPSLKDIIFGGRD